MTYGGLVAVIDDFFVQPAFRGLGLGKEAMRDVRSYCEGHGIRAISVETGRENAAALAGLSGCGFCGIRPCVFDAGIGRSDA